MRNGKWRFSCAEAVEDETSLWKGEEKWEEIPGYGFARMNTDKFFSLLLVGSLLSYASTLTETEGRPEPCAIPWPESVARALPRAAPNFYDLEGSLR
jgi:hypothetical protein